MRVRREASKADAAAPTLPFLPEPIRQAASPEALVGAARKVLPDAPTVEKVAVETRRAIAEVRASNSDMQEAVGDSAAAAVRGFSEFGQKVFDLWRAHQDAQMAFWRSTMAAGSLPGAVQPDGAGKAMEAYAKSWQELSALGTRMLTEMAQPLQRSFPTLR